MANTTIDSTGTLVYLVTEATSTTTKAACTTALATGFLIGKISGNIELGGDRATQEHGYLADDTEYAIGKVSYGTIQIDSPFSVADNVGQLKLTDSFLNKTRYKMLLKNTDGNFTTAPVFTKSAKKAYQADDFIMYNCTLQQNGASVEVVA